MGIYRVTEVTEVEADNEQAAIERAGSLEGAVLNVDRLPERGPDEHGCPQCGRTDMIEVTASAIGTVQLTLGGEGDIELEGHVDSVEWGALEDVDIISASGFTCRACRYEQEVDGDQELYDALNLTWH